MNDGLRWHRLISQQIGITGILYGEKRLIESFIAGSLIADLLVVSGKPRMLCSIN